MKGSLELDWGRGRLTGRSKGKLQSRCNICEKHKLNKKNCKNTKHSMVNKDGSVVTKPSKNSEISDT